MKKNPNAKVKGKHKPPKASKMYNFRLFVAGATTRSHEATINVRQMCESRLEGQYTLEVIDIYQQPGLARENQIVATPTLILDKPKPEQRFIGSIAIVSSLVVEISEGQGRIQH